ncbi:hypothetical protein F383_37951 [Gossypium arboreum]|uniref:Uncharacterized protein n=1 Tax=Gossypium arboreum TaxID=29729 RepID=A0A0B0MD26_GOSAR|nr:hypothetical protein F383_37951 [Gossypium arboreum]
MGLHAFFDVTYYNEMGLWAIPFTVKASAQ